MFMIFIPL